MHFWSLLAFTLLFIVAVTNAQEHPVTPTLVGSTPNEFNVTYGGAASYQVPLKLPVGAAGLKPTLSFHYNSQFGNGLMGHGWQLSSGLMRIEACYRRNTNQLIHCLNGEELRPVGGHYYRTEIDSGILVEATSGAEFRLHYQNGTIKTLTRFLSSPSVYLETEHAQRGGATYTVDWNVNTTHREPLIDSIHYQGNQIDFVYEDRSDRRNGYWLGAPRNRTQRLRSVIARVDGKVYRQYTAYYSIDSVSGLSRVEAIQECGTNNDCLEPLTFHWTDSGAAGISTSSGKSSGTLYSTANLNNDGIIDLTGYLGTPSDNANPAYTLYGDLNGDGRDEPVTVRHQGSGVSVNGHYFPDRAKVHVSDLNGDGKSEIIVRTYGNTRILSSDGSSRYLNVHRHIDCFYNAFFGDINGDNLPDIIYSSYSSFDREDDIHDDSLSCTRGATEVYLNRGNYTFDTKRIIFSDKAANLRFVDINGDGLQDVVTNHDNDVNHYYFLSRGNGQFTGRTTLPRTAKAPMFGDFNGDGLVDVVDQNGRYLRIAYNSRNGFGSLKTVASGRITRAIVGDKSGDGIQDLIVEYRGIQVWKGRYKRHYIETFTDSNGNEHRVEYSRLTDSSVYTRDSYSAGLNFRDNQPYQQALTVVKRLTTPNHQVFYRYAGARMHNGKDGYLGFKSITSVLAKEDEAGNPQSLVTASYLQQVFPFVGKVQTVKKKVYPGEAATTINHITYQYHDGQDHLVAMLNGEPVGINTTSGFADNIAHRGTATGTDFSGQMNSYFEWAALPLSGGVYHTYLKEKVVDHMQLSDDRLLKTERTRNEYDIVSGRYARLRETRHGTYTEKERLLNETRTHYRYEFTDGYGFPSSYLIHRATTTTHRANHPSEGVISPDSSNSDIHTVEREYDYYGSTALIQYEWLNREDAKGTRLHYLYDSYGNLTRTTLSAVNADSSQSESARTSHTRYLNQGKYVASETNDKGHTATFQDYTVHGLPGTTRDITGLTTQFVYDSLGRVERTIDTLNNSHYTHRGYCSQDNRGCTNGAYQWQHHQPAGAAESYSWWNRKGELVKTASQSLNPGEWVVQAWEYDQYGRVSRESVPVIQALASTIGFAATSDRHYTEYRYDEVGRIITQQLPGVNRVVTKNYQDEHAVITIDPAGRRTANVTNALGQITHNIQPDNSQLRFEYNAQGHVTVQSFPKGSLYREVVNTYDRYGNLIQMSDPSRGQWHYHYNSFGELIQQTDGRGEHVYFSYDTLGRLHTQRDSETYAIWHWDGEEPGLIHSIVQYDIRALSNSAKNNLSPSTISSSGARRVWQQDTRYNDLNKLPEWVQTRQQDRHGQLLTSTATNEYDGFGRLEYTQLPALYRNQGSLSAPRLAYGYSDTGYLDRISDRDSASLYQRVTAMDAFGNITTQDLAGNVELFRQYDSSTGWASDLQASNSRGLLIEQSYSDYNALGYIGQRDDAVYYPSGQYQSWTDTYAYNDSLQQQLTDVQVHYEQSMGGISLNENWTHRFSYNHLGNRLSSSITLAGSFDDQLPRTGTTQYQYNDSARPHRLSSTTGNLVRRYQYDGNGNVLNDGSKIFEYNAHNKLGRVTNGTNRTRFEYSPDRTRYLRVDTQGNQTTETLYVGAGYERVTTEDGGTTVTHKYHVYGIALIIQTEGANTEETHALIIDYQESLLAITDEDGEISQRFRYTPYGEQVEVSAGLASSSFLTTQGYTSHEHIESMDLIHMGGRIYDPLIGRMLQTDIVTQAPDQILSYNRYAYVWNNPMNMVDPSGYMGEGDDSDGTGDQGQDTATDASTDVGVEGKSHVNGTTDPETYTVTSTRTTVLTDGSTVIDSISITHGTNASPNASAGVASDPEGAGQGGMGDDEEGGSGLDSFQTALDVAGLTPGIGIFADVLNTAIHLGRGNWAGAALSAVAIVPGIGQIATGTKLGTKVTKYEVGTFDNLTKRSTLGDKLDIHHVTQKHPGKQVIPGYDPKTAPSIAVPAREHRRIPTIKGNYPGNPRDLLAKDIKDLRKYTNAPNVALQDLIKLNKTTYPGVFN